MKKTYLLALALVAIIFFCNNEIIAQWANGQEAAFVMGQPDWSTYSSGSATNEFNSPRGVAIDYTNNKLYVADLYNNRVLRFSYPISGNRPTPERVFGTGSATYAQNTLPYPISVAVYNNTLWVVNDRRITKFNNAHLAASDGPNADGVLGQSDYSSSSYTTSPSQFFWVTDIAIDASGNMWVVDYSSHRALKFNDVNNKSDGDIANLVLGQSDFTSNSSGTTEFKFSSPNGVAINGTTVWVADGSNNRVLRFDNPTSHGQIASGVLGQSDYTISTSGLTAGKFESPYDVTIDASGRLYVSDKNNARIMIFNDAASKINGAAADNVLGQSDFTTRATTNGGQNRFYYDGMSWAVGCATVDPINNKLLVSDESNHRVMIFAAISALPVELTSFTAVVRNNKTSLNWQTATEVDNYGFEVQRSVVSGQLSEWETIGFVNGHGNSNSPKDYSFVDNKVSSVGKYYYRLKQIDSDGSFEYSDIVEVDFGQPNKFELMQNYPNPFNPSTKISYTVPQDSKVRLTLFNTLGQKIGVLIDGFKEAGFYTYQLSIDNYQLQSGVYFYKLEAGSFAQVKKMIIAK